MYEHKVATHITYVVNTAWPNIPAIQLRTSCSTVPPTHHLTSPWQQNLVFPIQTSFTNWEHRRGLPL